MYMYVYMYVSLMPLDHTCSCTLPKGDPKQFTNTKIFSLFVVTKQRSPDNGQHSLLFQVKSDRTQTSVYRVFIKCEFYAMSYCMDCFTEFMAQVHCIQAM